MKLILVKPKHTSKRGTSFKSLVAAERGVMNRTTSPLTKLSVVNTTIRR